jgi:hypothetical protein
VYPRSTLSEDKLVDNDKLVNYVDSFLLSTFRDSESKVIFVDRGFPKTQKRFIDTNKLLSCKTRAKALELPSMFCIFFFYTSLYFVLHYRFTNFGFLPRRYYGQSSIEFV